MSLIESNNVHVVGIPFSGGQPKGGVDAGPAALRAAGVVASVESLGWKVVSDQDVPVPTPVQTTVEKLKNPHWVGDVCRGVYEKVYERVKGGEACLNIGGDHSIAAGSIAAVLKRRPDAFIVWVDAHADINTPATTESGNLHGMPVAFLARLAGDVPGFEWMRDVPKLRPDRLVYVGLRDVDEGEKVLLKDHNIKHYYSHNVARQGIAEVTKEILELTAGLPIHISFDIDALDPTHAPATGTPVHEGLTLEDGKHLCSKLAATGRVVSIDLVEVNPSLSDADGARVTDESAIEIIKAALTRKV